MKEALLIADSGGTRTDWCLIESSGKTKFFETESYHPNNITHNWVLENKEFWDKYTKEYDLEIKFFGSGCLNPNNQELLKRSFEAWGIIKVDVQSDLLAAARACFGDSDGLVGILGTGSVLANIENKTIKNVYGGFGYILGDEGSGYYYGKLLVQKFLKSQFSENCLKEITSLTGDKDSVIKSVYSNSGKQFISQLAEKFSDSNQKELIELHKENLRLFFDNYLPINQNCHKIDLVGSYAYSNMNLIESILSDYPYELGHVLKKPIEQLADYYKKHHL